MRVKNENMLQIDGTDSSPSLASTWTSKPLWLGHIVNYSIQLVFTGTPNGTFKLQVCNDLGEINSASEVMQANKLVNWTDYSNSEQAITEAGDHTYEVMESGHNWVRVLWQPSGVSSGTVTSARAYLKGV